MIEIHEYLDDKGESAFANWFEALDTQAALKVTTYMSRLETGNTSALKSLGKGLWALAEAVGKSPKSLMRMLGASGNPTANNLFGIISLLQEKEGVHLQTKAAS